MLPGQNHSDHKNQEIVTRIVSFSPGNLPLFLSGGGGGWRDSPLPPFLCWQPQPDPSKASLPCHLLVRSGHRFQRWRRSSHRDEQVFPEGPGTGIRGLWSISTWGEGVVSVWVSRKWFGWVSTPAGSQSESVCCQCGQRVGNTFCLVAATGGIPPLTPPP